MTEILQVDFKVPPELLARLNAGDLTRHNGVIRNELGEIVHHLKEADQRSSDVHLNTAPDGRAQSGRVAIGVGLVVVVAASGAVVWRARKRRAKSLRCVDCWNEALKVYLAAITNQSLDQNVIDELTKALDALAIMVDERAISIDIAPTSLPEVSGVVAKYTRALAEANSLSLREPAVSEASSPPGPVAELRRYLVIQREIFDRLA